MDIDDWAYKQRELQLGRPFISIENHGKKVGPDAPKNIDYPLGLCASAKMKDQIAQIRQQSPSPTKRMRDDEEAVQPSPKKHKADVYAAVGNDNPYGMGY